MPQPLAAALADVRALLLDSAGLRRAVAAGRRRGAAPSVVRVELRPVDLKAGPRLQVVASDGTRPSTRNVAWGGEAATVIDELLAEPFGNWHVETAAETVQLRVTKKGEAQVHRAAAGDRQPGGHDREARHLLDPGDPLFDMIGGSAAKRRQVDAFLRSLDATFDAAPDRLPRPLRVVDLGCGNAYLTFATYQFLTSRGLDVDLIGVDVRDDQRERNTTLARQLGWAERVRFVAGSIAEAPIAFGGPAEPGGEAGEVHVVLALHACDTATDEALARAVRWRAPYVLAAPCCHHDIAAQLRGAPATLLTRHGILRERLADVLTDAARAALLRLHGYRVEVVEFVDSMHTPRNLLLRARRTDAAPTAEHRAEYAGLTAAWGITPALERLLAG
jgi:SAM-dependent methyltransferase